MHVQWFTLGQSDSVWRPKCVNAPSLPGSCCSCISNLIHMDIILRSLHLQRRRPHLVPSLSFLLSYLKNNKKACRRRESRCHHPFPERQGQEFQHLLHCPGCRPRPCPCHRRYRGCLAPLPCQEQVRAYCRVCCLSPVVLYRGHVTLPPLP